MRGTSPWTVTSAKRKSSTPVASATRRKRRLSDGDVRPRIKRRPKQETLTQIGWIPSSRNVSFNDEYNDLEFIDGDPVSRTTKREARPSTLRKGDSTLTQMDFFGPKMEYNGIDDDDFMIYEDIAATNDDTEGQVARSHPIVDRLQLDGTYDSPRKSRRKRKLYTEQTTEDGTNASDKEYQPFQKRRTTATPSKPPPRRAATTARHKILSDPEQNLTYFDAALKDQDTTSPKRGALGIQNQAQNDRIEAASKQPQTPQKFQKVILSSQSPESLPPSSRIAVRTIDAMKSPHRPSPRKPLQSLDINTPCRVEREHKRKGSTSTLSPSPKHKICILKMPRKPIQRQKSTIADSQEDVFSIPSTSSPAEVELISANVPAVNRRSNATGKGPEIPNTSQLDLDANMPSSPPDEHGFQYLADLPEFGMLRDDPISQPVESPVLVRDFAGSFDKNMTPRHQVVSNDQTRKEETETDFGSPIANDTQFNAAFKIPTPRLVHQQSKIPLNDVRDRPLAVSPSQRLPTQTQRSVRPAAMPRQSQISTQDPTQSMHLPSSSMPTSSPHYGTQKHESITIKDSSSLPASLSQIPHFNEDDEGEIDLDDDHVVKRTPHPPASQYRPRVRPLPLDEGDATELQEQLIDPHTAEPSFPTSDHPSVTPRIPQGIMPDPYQTHRKSSMAQADQMPAWYFENPLEGLTWPEPREIEEEDEDEDDVDTQDSGFESVKSEDEY